MQSRSRELQAVRAFDDLVPTRDALAEIAGMAGEWAGLPMPLEGERLVVEPSYPWARLFDPPADGPSEDEGWSLRNEWYSRHHRCQILIMNDPDGRIVHGKMPAFHHIGYDMRTLGCSVAWGIEQEGKAVRLLASMLRHTQFKQYLLTGMFLERSSRSNVMYLFRKLKPTIALSPGISRDWEASDSGVRILAALCMHPIAYYADSWAGAMCPTDDVIAHLTLMRGDEHLYWRRCNQHPPNRPEAGL